MIEPWVVFRLHGQKELAAYTVRGTFPGECEGTRHLLACDYGVSDNEITIAVEERQTQRRTAAPSI